MEVFSPEGHEQVVICQDRATGLRAIIALYSTVLGPGLGGTRFHPYPTEQDALADALRLSRAMAYKNAVAGLAAGGGKAVILGDPARDKSEELLRAYGRFVATLGGRYITACDVGTYVADMDVVGTVCPWTTGRSRSAGGAGDSGELTAYGVFQGMRAGAEHVFGAPTLAGRRVSVAGLGKVGARLVGHLLADGATVVAADTAPAAVARVREQHPAARVVAPDELLAEPADVFSPNALGGALTAGVVELLRAAGVRLVCGGANNQLAAPGVDALLAGAGISYCPDYVVNAGGVIAVADEGLDPPYDHERATARVAGVFDTTRVVLRQARDSGVLPARAADLTAERRMAAARDRPLWMPVGAALL